VDWDIDELVSQIGLQLPSARGRKPREHSLGLEVGDPRPLRAEDVVASVGAKPLPTSTPPALQKLRSRHHQLAQLLSSGLTDFQVSVALGYSLSRISILKSDPAFKELLAYYEKQHEALHLDVQERLIHLGLDSIETLQGRLDEDPDDFTNKELLEVAEMALDRTGHGKSSTVSVLHGLDDETHALLKAQHEASRQGRVLNLSDGEFIEVGQDANSPEQRSEATDISSQVRPEPDPDRIEALGREITDLQASLHPDAEAKKWLEHSEGVGLPEEVDRSGQSAELLVFPTSTILGPREE
jgi:aryl carrier-like protein